MPIGPGQTLRLPIRLIAAEGQRSLPCPAAFGVRAVLREGGSGRERSTGFQRISLRCRKLDSESFLFTFIDHDGAVGHAAAIAPLNGDACSA